MRRLLAPLIVLLLAAPSAAWATGCTSPTGVTGSPQMMVSSNTGLIQVCDSNNSWDTALALLGSSGSASIGIGTSSPSAAQLQINAVSGYAYQAVFENTTNTANSQIQLRNDQNSNVRALEFDYYGSTASSGEHGAIGTTGAYPLYLYTSNSTSPPAMVLSSGGSVGIGTTGPGYTLEVNGSVGVDNNITLTGSGSSGVGTIYGPAGGGGNSYIAFNTNTSEPSGQRDTYISFYDCHYGVNCGVRMTLDPSGNLGIGTTSPGGKLDVEGGTSGLVVGSVSNPSGNAYGMTINSVSANTTSGGAYGLYIASGAFPSYGSGGAYSIYDNSGTYKFFNGNVGIGTTSPGAALEVNGTAQFDGAVSYKAFTVTDPSSGSTYTISNGINYLVLDNYIAATTLTVQMPASPTTGQIVTIGVDGYPYTTFTLQANSGQSLAGAVAPTSLYPGQSIALMWVGNGYWYPVGGFPTQGAAFSGNVGIGTTGTSSYTLTVNGTVGAEGWYSDSNGILYPSMVTYTSDRRLKTTIKPVTGSLSDIEELTPITFRWNDKARTAGLSDDREHIGLIAQDVEKVFPQAVVTDSKGFKHVDYPSLVAPLVGAAKELADKQSEMQRQLDDARTALSALAADEAKLIDFANSIAADKATIKADNEALAADNQALRDAVAQLKAERARNREVIDHGAM